MDYPQSYILDFQWSKVLLAGVLAVLIAFVTVSLHTVKAARVNPSENLKE